MCVCILNRKGDLFFGEVIPSRYGPVAHVADALRVSSVSFLGMFAYNALNLLNSFFSKLVNSFGVERHDSSSPFQL